MTSPVGDAKSLPLILARELASNLATPMFLIDAKGTLVFFNEAAELLIGRTFGRGFRMLVQTWQSRGGARFRRLSAPL